MLLAEVNSAVKTRERTSAAVMWPSSLARLRQALPWLTAGWALLTVAKAHLIGWTTDWHVFWTAGHAVVTGNDPYAAVVALANGYPLFYPGPALLLLAPFGLLPSRIA